MKFSIVFRGYRKCPVTWNGLTWKEILPEYWFHRPPLMLDYDKNAGIQQKKHLYLNENLKVFSRN